MNEPSTEKEKESPNNNNDDDEPSKESDTVSGETNKKEHSSPEPVAAVSSARDPIFVEIPEEDDDNASNNIRDIIETSRKQFREEKYRVMKRISPTLPEAVKEQMRLEELKEMQAEKEVPFKKFKKF